MTKLWCIAFGFAFGLCVTAMANNILTIKDAFGVTAQIEAKRLPDGTYRIVCEAP